MWAEANQNTSKAATTRTKTWQLLFCQLNKNLKLIPKNFRDKFLHVNSIEKSNSKLCRKRRQVSLCVLPLHLKQSIKWVVRWLVLSWLDTRPDITFN